MARGFENFVYFSTAAYRRAGKLKLDVPPRTAILTVSEGKKTAI
jgi:hypothetical protein